MATARVGADDVTGQLRFHWFERMLDMLPTGRLVDLGAGHGLFALAAADRGWQVTAVDARGDRYPATRDPRVEWKVGDVRDEKFDDYDAIACLGLWYHLTIDDQIDLLARTAGTPIVLDTHTADARQQPARRRSSLSEVTVLRGYKGRLYREPDQATNSPASWGNDYSFWPTATSLHRMLDDHGYDVMTAHPKYLPNRTFFLCLPR